MDLGDMFMSAMAASRGARGQSHPSTPAKDLPTKLQELEARYNESIPFEPGDLITARAEAAIKGQGKPMVVLEVIEDAEPTFMGNGVDDHGSGNYGNRLNLRIATEIRGRIVAHWTEAWQYEAWTPEHQAKLEADEAEEARAATAQDAGDESTQDEARAEAE